MKIFGYEIIIRKEKPRNDLGRFVSQQKISQDAMTKRLKAEINTPIDYEKIRGKM